jgi:hypothetical protein
MRKSTIRIGVSTVLAASVLVGGGLVGVPSAFGAKTPKLFASPSAGLLGGQTVKVHGTGFKPKDNVYLVQCLATATGGSQCNTLAALPVTINAKGDLPMTKFTLVAGSIGNGACGTTKKNLKACEISAGNANGGDSASVRIIFRLKK